MVVPKSRQSTSYFRGVRPNYLASARILDMPEYPVGRASATRDSPVTNHYTSKRRKPQRLKPEIVSSTAVETAWLSRAKARNR